MKHEHIAIIINEKVSEVISLPTTKRIDGLHMAKLLTFICGTFYLSLLFSCSFDTYSEQQASLVIEPRFDKPGFSEGLTVTNSSDQWGYFDRNGSFIIDLGAKGITLAANFQEGLAVFKKDKKWGFLNKQGDVVIAPNYDKAWQFSNGLAAVERDRLWGYVDRTGKEVIPPSFVVAYPFQDGLARVNVGGSIQGIFYKGNQFAGYHVEGGRQGYINIAGNIVIEGEFDILRDFVHGFAKVNLGGKLNDRGRVEGGKWGFIDSSGCVLVQPIYDEVKNFEEGFAAVRGGEKWGLLDSSGRVVLEPSFEESFYFSEGLAAVRKEKGLYGYIDTKCRYVIKPIFRVAGDFVEGLAPASVDGKLFGFINKRGEWAIKPTFYDVEHFSEGFAIIHFPGGKNVERKAWGRKSKYKYIGGGFTEVTRRSFIDVNGRRITRQEFGDAHGFKDGMAAVKIKGKWGYLSVHQAEI